MSSVCCGHGVHPPIFRGATTRDAFDERGEACPRCAYPEPLSPAWSYGDEQRARRRAALLATCLKIADPTAVEDIYSALRWATESERAGQSNYYAWGNREGRACMLGMVCDAAEIPRGATEDEVLARVRWLAGLRMEREPSDREMEAALGDLSETFYEGWTVRRCIDCRTPVAGGPTRCMRCAWRMENGPTSDDIRQRYNELLYAVLDIGPPDKRTPEEAHRQTVAKARWLRKSLDAVYELSKAAGVSREALKAALARTPPVPPPPAPGGQEGEG
jgi:hypothetical protein